MTNEELQERAKKCQQIAERILKEKGMNTYRAVLKLDDKVRIVIEYYQVHPRFTQNDPWHFECDFIFHPNNTMEYWAIGSTSWNYNFSIEQFEKLMNDVGNYYIV